MSRLWIIRPDAQEELDSQAEYLAAHASNDVALRFLTAFHATVALLADRPGLGSQWVSEEPHLQGIRKHAVRGFPNHLILYRDDTASLDVLHIFHGMQDIETLLSGGDPDDPVE